MTSCCHDGDESNCRRDGSTPEKRAPSVPVAREWLACTGQRGVAAAWKPASVASARSPPTSARRRSRVTGGRSGFNTVLGGGRNDKDTQYAHRRTRLLFNQFGGRTGPDMVLQLRQRRAVIRTPRGWREACAHLGAVASESDGSRVVYKSASHSSADCRGQALPRAGVPGRVIVANEPGLRRMLTGLRSRTHLALAKDSPVPRPVHHHGGASWRRRQSVALHHRYDGVAV